MEEVRGKNKVVKTMTKKRWKRKTGSWAAHQSRLGPEAQSWSSQHLLLPHSQGKHIILTDAWLNGFCGETFTGSVTVSPDSLSCCLHTKISHNPFTAPAGWHLQGRSHTATIFQPVIHLITLSHQPPELWMNPSTCQNHKLSHVRNKHTVSPTFTVKHYHLVSALRPRLSLQNTALS